MRRTVLILAGMLLCVVALGSDSPKGYDSRTQVDELEGAWRLTEMKFGGKMHTLLYEAPLTFCNGTYTFIWPDKMQGNYRINPICKPYHLDWMPLGKCGTVKLIYQIDGDTLRIGCVDGAKRPQAFNNDDVNVLFFKRVK